MVKFYVTDDPVSMAWVLSLESCSADQSAKMSPVVEQLLVGVL